MPNKLLLTLFALTLVLTLSAGDFIIDAGTSTINKVPVYGYNNYGWSKFFYTATEMAAAGVTGDTQFTKIAFKVSDPIAGYTMDNQKIYIRSFYDTSYTSSTATYPIPSETSGFINVFNGSVTFNGPGWNEITFQTPYNYAATWGLEILWENRDGSKLSGPPKFYYSSQSNSCVYKSQDPSFPTTSGSKGSYHPNVWFVSAATDIPNPAVAVNPVDSATDVAITSSLSWNHTGGDPDDYLFSLWTTESPTWIENGLVTTTTSYTPATYLEYGKTYNWRVIPRNEFGQALGCPNWSFTTVADPSIVSFPWTESFDGTSFPPNDSWLLKGGNLVDPIVLGGSSIWGQGDWLNIAGTDKAAKINIWANINGWLISPLFNVSDPNAYLTFDLAFLKANQPPTGTPPALTGDDDRFAVLIGDGFTWSTANIVREWNNTGSPYVLNSISTTGEKVIIALNGHTGHIRIAFFAGSTISNADNDFLVNNMYVGAYLPEPVVSISNDPLHNTCTLSWAYIDGATTYEVQSSATPYGPWNLLDSTATNQYVLTPTETKAFYKVKAINNR
ncbi:MAG: hypothetical protein RBS43_02620 [Candidatus Cloacimonas sp.]|jgi:hypothetical protein|nr:hypothetical protein [Candidatus Cloacimonas sp.]